MKGSIASVLVLLSLVPAIAYGAPVVEEEANQTGLQARQRCTIPFWDYWRNPNNCALIYPGYPGQGTVNPTPRPTSTRSTTSRSSTSTRSSSTPTTTPSRTSTIGTPVPTTTTTGVPTTTTTTVTPTVVPTGDLTADQQLALSRSNQYRALHNVPAFTWDAALAASAQAVASTCVFEHSQGDYGENLAAGTGDYSYTSAIASWYNEIRDYDFDNPGFSSATGHFTQLVWAASTTVGCARNTQCTPQQLGFGSGFGTQATFVVCQYRPPGNVIGAFAQNVLPPA